MIHKLLVLLSSLNSFSLIPPRMAILGTHTSFIFGLLGNVVSFLVYLAPLPTFYRIFKKKSTEGFQSVPYSVALFSAMLTLYYGLLKPNGILLITINSIGCVIESFYLIFYMIYATKSSKTYTAKLLVFFNFGAFGLVALFTYLFSTGHRRMTIVGWTCAVFSVCVFAAPLSVIRLVIKTKSAEYMPFPLSVCLTICAVMWFMYGLSVEDFFVATPNILGLAFGVTQMILYIVYRKRGNEIMPVVHPKEEANGVHMSNIADQPRNNSDRPQQTEGISELPNTTNMQPSEENV
ncbi:bidirectional sugar transporter N3-like [Mangifera indica]|uniref:bidirectional sugar transporter N3-like n=1 Tax=Mangifera indica TaxID=29780 RepID=UPI001CFB90EE|nr:bidirectional sugar transporter N3-like [Mangifera indica]